MINIPKTYPQKKGETTKSYVQRLIKLASYHAREDAKIENRKHFDKCFRKGSYLHQRLMQENEKSNYKILL